MKRILVQLLIITGCLLGFASVASAQATRTWVSGVGDDANPCSRTAPCKTFAGAISKTAPIGEINVLDPGGFGAVTITKAITIDGSGGSIAGVLVSGTNGIIVNAGATDTVVLRNLDLNGLGTGINGVQFLAGKALIIENCKIFGFTTGVNAVLAAAGDVVIRDSEIHNISGTGVNIAPTAGTTHASLRNVSIRFTANGIVTNNSNAAVDVSDSTIIASTTDGAHAIGGSISLDSSMLARNNVGVLADTAGAGTIRVNNVTFYDNNTAMGCGGSVVSGGNNHLSKVGLGCAPTGTMIVQ